MILAQEQHYCEEKFKRTKKQVHTALLEKNSSNKQMQKMQQTQSLRNTFHTDKTMHATSKSVPSKETKHSKFGTTYDFSQVLENKKFQEL